MKVKTSQIYPHQEVIHRWNSHRNRKRKQVLLKVIPVQEMTVKLVLTQVMVVLLMMQNLISVNQKQLRVAAM